MAYTKESFIKKAKEIHGDKYDYSKVEYIDYSTPVTIICPKHGEFKQAPYYHLDGGGCLMCKNEEKFIEKAKKKYGDKYDYSKVVYMGSAEEVCIICPEHGEFWQSPTTHLNTKVGCPECAKIKNGNRRHEECKSKFIEKARKKHGNKYDYSKVEYSSIYDKICIICPEHGEFYTSVINHIGKHQGGGCPTCGKTFSKRIREEKKDEFFKKTKELYGDKYDLSKVEYNGMNKAVTFICPVHGEFRLTPKTFLRTGCIKCKNGEEFVKKAKELYGDRFDYSKVVYNGVNERVCIIDKEKGEFWQTPVSHIECGKYNNCKKKDGSAVIEKWTYDVCKEIAETCQFSIEFSRKCPSAYSKAYSKGWLKDFNWLKEYTPARRTVIYVYELPNKYAYVGLTNNLERRDFQHRDVTKKSKDYLTEYCINNGIEIPKPKILEEGLTRREGGNAEKKWIKEYKKNGWTMINKNGGGGLGTCPKLLMTEEEVINICKNYKNMEELCNRNTDVYHLMNKMGIKKKCFPNATFVDNMAKPRDYNEEYIAKIVDKYPSACELRKHDNTFFQWMYKHNRLKDFYEMSIRRGPRKK